MKSFIYKSRCFASLDSYKCMSGFNHFMRIVYFLTGFFFLAGSALAQSGGTAGQIMSYGVGARALGMGGAFFAVADDATAAYWNPAALVFLKRKEFSTMQSSMFADTSLSFFTYAHPTTTKGTLAISMTQLKSVGFEKVSIEANPAGDEIISVKKLGSFDSAESVMSLVWGRNVSDTLAFGFAVKNFTRSLDTSADSFKVIDISMLQRFSRTYRMAIGVQNVFSMKSGDTDDKLPLTFKFGQALSLFKGSLVFGLDFIKPQQADMGWRFGGEYWLLSWAALRFGVMGSPGIQEADLGVGIRYGSLTFDLAQGIHALGTATRFSITMRMGKSNRAKHDRQVRILVRQAMAYFKVGYFSKALAKLRAALDAAPGNAQVTRMLTRLKNAVEYVPGATGGEELPTLVRRGVISYVDGKNLRNSINILRHAFNKDPRNDNLLSLLNMIEKEARISELTKKPEGPQIFTYIDQKTYDSREAIYQGKYDLAMKRSQDILELEPNNETALEIMGSAFYLMDQPEKARAIWERVLDINPNNRMVKKFLRQVR